MKKYINILYVLAEDDALNAVASGFLKNIHIAPAHMRTLPYARGWKDVLSQLKNTYIPDLQKYCFSKVHLLVLIDCDGHIARISDFQKEIPSELKDRVFIIGLQNEAEYLKKELKKTSAEETGKVLAHECVDPEHSQGNYWQGAQLGHNAPEVARLKSQVWDFIYKP